jgi:hypothetical protein
MSPICLETSPKKKKLNQVEYPFGILKLKGVMQIPSFKNCVDMNYFRSMTSQSTTRVCTLRHITDTAYCTDKSLIGKWSINRTAVAGVYLGGPGSTPGQFMCDLSWWRGRGTGLLPSFFGFPLSVLFHNSSVCQRRYTFFIKLALSLTNTVFTKGSSASLFPGTPVTSLRFFIVFLSR